MLKVWWTAWYPSCWSWNQISKKLWLKAYVRNWSNFGKVNVRLWDCSCKLRTERGSVFLWGFMLLSFICKQNSRTWLSAVAYWWCVLGSISLLAVWCSWQYLCEVCCQGGWPQCTQHSHWSQALPYCLFTRLSNLFHGMDKNTPVRYTVYCSLIKVAASCGAIQYIPTELDQVSYHVEYLFCL